jgi:hypothetical protein
VHGIDVGRLFEPVTGLMFALLILNAIVGGAMVQQAYASGAAEVVLATLTVVDPMIAVMFGLIALNEGADLATGAVVGMIICGLAAVAGVITLARAHPEVAARRRQAATAPRPELAAASAISGGALQDHFDDSTSNSSTPVRDRARVW